MGDVVSPLREDEMATKLSAEIIHGGPGSETSTHYYVRSVYRTVSLLQGIRADAWAAYRDTPVIVDGEWLMRSERLSTSPRETVEEAVADMEAAVSLALDSNGIEPRRLRVDCSPLEAS